jgi:D-alanyl-D-alanine carboxypeptidase
VNPPRRPPLLVVVVLLLVTIAGLALLRRSGAPEPAQAADPAESPPPSTDVSPSGAPALPRCRYADTRAAADGYDDWRSTPLDTTFRVARSYEPPDLVSVGEAGFRGTQTARRFVIDDLARLRRAAASAGNPIDIIWGYRSFATQQSVFQRAVDLKGYDRALRSAARPGHSEHQLGTVFDFKTLGAANVYRTWESEPAGRWMAANAWHFGFVMSYPKGSEDVTCYSYEPWHYRYLGRQLAAEVHASGEPLRAFLWSHRDGSEAP